MRNENNRGTDVGRRRKTPRKLRGAEDTACKYYASTGQRFLLSKAGVSERVHTGARSAVDRGVRLARRPRRRLISLARRPPATPTPHSAPLLHRRHPRRTRRRAPAHYAPTLTYATFQNSILQMQKINNFPLLKRRGNRNAISKRRR